MKTFFFPCSTQTATFEPTNYVPPFESNNYVPPHIVLPFDNTRHEYIVLLRVVLSYCTDLGDGAEEKRPDRRLSQHILQALHERSGRRRLLLGVQHPQRYVKQDNPQHLPKIIVVFSGMQQ